MPEASYPTLIAALREPAAYGHPVEAVRLIETHISWVLLTGTYAYKIKKPVDFGFLDFSTLEKRRFFCEEELRLNRRFAPELYLAVLPITGEPAHPTMDGTGKPLEYAVKMKQFDDADSGDRLATDGRLRPEHIDSLAETLATFHDQAARANPEDQHGLPEAVQKAAEENFSQIRAAPAAGQERTPLDELHAWTRAEYQRLQQHLWARKQTGFIRECHGDLHLGNLVLIGERLVPFDCIEFSESLRWVDVISEMAFIVMDLEVGGHRPLAFRLLNRYLEITGDYAGLDLLDYYRVYRALVRAKIASLTRAQSGRDSERDALARRYRSYVRYAEETSRSRRPRLVITHGFSGSGKSYLAARLAETLPAIRLRSDIERKRLADLAGGAATGSTLGGGIYTQDMTRLTYDHLLETARNLLAAGFSVIVDATFLDRARRRAQRLIAEELGAGFAILSTHAPVDVLRQRVETRRAMGTDPSEANLDVLDWQMAHHEPLDEAERASALLVDTRHPPRIEVMADEIRRRFRSA
jgi:aminoglycoside phosphotransferase family enzyme/predicted kinase